MGYHCRCLLVPYYFGQLDAAKREISYHRTFRHPNLMDIVDSAIVEDSKYGTIAYLLLPYLSGGSLRDHINLQLAGERAPEIRTHPQS